MELDAMFCLSIFCIKSYHSTIFLLILRNSTSFKKIIIVDKVFNKTHFIKVNFFFKKYTKKKNSK